MVANLSLGGHLSTVYQGELTAYPFPHLSLDTATLPGQPGDLGSRHYPCFPFAGREPQLRDSLLQEFREVALSMGIPENSIVFMADRGKWHLAPL